jgi:predicted Zn-dependent protease
LGWVIALPLVISFVAIRPLFADPELPMLGVNAQVNLQKEYQLGKEFFETLKDSGLVIDDPMLDRYINDLGTSLLSLLDVRLRSYRFFLVRDNSVNAFAVPGGFIGVNAGLIALSTSEDEVAAVLAHEIAHVELRHTMQLIEHSRSVNTMGMLSILAAILLGSQNPDLARALVATGAAGSGQSMVNFTRTNEYEADRLGIDLLKKSEYQPRAMARFMHLLQRKEQAGSVSSIEYLRTHPLGANRIAEIENRLALVDERSPLKNNSRFTRFEQFRDYLYFIYPEAEPTERDTEYRHALKLMETGDFSAARAALEQLVGKDPDSMWYRYSLAICEQLQGNFARANQIYRRLLLLYPQDLVLGLKLGRNLLAMGSIQDAKSLFESMRKFHLEQPSLYQGLVELYQASGDDQARQLAEADYHWYGGNQKRAVQLYQVMLSDQQLDLVSEQKLRQKISEYNLKKDGITE